MQSLKLFKGRTLVIATMHGKEKVIAPIVKNALGVKVILPKNFNTDQYGAFSGEIDQCVNCNYSSLKQFPNGRDHEDPQFCDYYNP